MNRIPGIGLLLCLLGGPLAFAAATTEADRPRMLEEIVVEATRAKLNVMRQEMIAAEERFFERYNELNTIDDFDTQCYMETRAGTLLKRRFCRAVFQTDALEATGREYVEYLKQTTPTPNANPADKPPEANRAAGPPAPAIMAYAARQKEYQQNILAVTRQDAELVKLLVERVELEQRYDAIRRKAFGQETSAEETAASTQSPP